MASGDILVSIPWKQTLMDDNYKDNKENENIVEVIASRELRESPRIREQCLVQFREWIKQNNDMENCLTGQFYFT